MVDIFNIDIFMLGGDRVFIDNAEIIQNMNHEDNTGWYDGEGLSPLPLLPEYRFSSRDEEKSAGYKSPVFDSSDLAKNLAETLFGLKLPSVISSSWLSRNKEYFVVTRLQVRRDGCFTFFFSGYRLHTCGMLTDVVMNRSMSHGKFFVRNLSGKWTPLRPAGYVDGNEEEGLSFSRRHFIYDGKSIKLIETENS